jgi:hypothetical protein
MIESALPVEKKNGNENSIVVRWKREVIEQQGVITGPEATKMIPYFLGNLGPTNLLLAL